MQDLNIDERLVSQLKLNSRNARTHGKRQVEQIAASIREFGFNNPLLVDENDMVIAGHGRLEAARLLGRESVPVIRLAHLSAAQKAAFVIADNRLAELAGWNKETLSIELQSLLESDIGFSLSDIGFETAEVDFLLQVKESTDQPDPADQVIEEHFGPAVSRPGDVWLIGEHRLHCGDALLAASYKTLMDGELAQMAFTDPPYNVPVAGHVSGLGKARHDEFIMASGEMSEAEFTSFLSIAFREMASFTSDGSIHFVCMDWRHLFELLKAGRIAYSELKNLCAWVKSNGGMGSLYRSQHELVGVFKNGSAPHVNNVELGKHGRYRTNVWSYPGMNGFQSGRDELLALHPTVKPVAMVADAILDCSDRGTIVLDPFLGSGTTILAAERTGRRCYALELDPRYVDVALRRVRGITGIEPICAETGKAFRDFESIGQRPAD